MRYGREMPSFVELWVKTFLFNVEANWK